MEAPLELPPADGGLTCPLWVQFHDPDTGTPYFFNVQTHERARGDPDPAGWLRCCRMIEGATPGGSREDSVGEALAADPAGTDADPGGEPAAASPVAAALAAARAAWWTRPARVQVERDNFRTQYSEGAEDYNVWYGKYENDRFNPKDKEPAPYRCDPELDAGWTTVDQPGAERSFFCTFFARGCCNLGHRCTYYHHIPTVDDSNACDIAHDIFGRERFAGHREDLGGVGSFNSEGLSLFVGNLQFDRTDRDTIPKVDQQLHEAFGVWGTLESVRLLPPRAIAFVRYAHRGAAEFAKVAMDNQQLGPSRRISVRWALDDPHPRERKKARVERRDLVDEAVLRRAISLGLTEQEVAGLILTNQPKGFNSVTAPYPDTSAQYTVKTSAVLLGPATDGQEAEQAQAKAEQAEGTTGQAEAVGNMVRMSVLLARIDEMLSSGAVEAADEV